MTLNFDTDQPVVGLRGQQALIKAVLAASSADESRWLEWKSTLDVVKPAGAFAVAKAILGFANRMPDVAAQWVGGHAYLVVGAEPGVIHGVVPHDVADVDPWIARYVGDFDRYQFTYVPFDNGDGTRHVMLVDVSPPRWGDPLHQLRKDYDNSYAGTIFHRYPGRTQPARAPEIDALNERVRRAAHRIDVDVTTARGCVALTPQTEEFRKRVVDILGSGMTGKLTSDPSSTRSGRGIASSYSSMLGALIIPDARSEDEFMAEVEEYLTDFDAAMLEAFAHEVDRKGNPFHLRLTNPGETFLAQVEVVVTLPDTVHAHLVDDDAEVDWPTAPHAWGEGTPAYNVAGLLTRPFPPILRPSIPAPDIADDNGQTVIRYVPVDLRPHETVTLDPIGLYSHQTSPEPIIGQWRATATNVSGSLQRSLPLTTQQLDIDLRTVCIPSEYRSEDSKSSD